MISLFSVINVSDVLDGKSTTSLSHLDWISPMVYSAISNVKV